MFFWNNFLSFSDTNATTVEFEFKLNLLHTHFEILGII